MRKKRVFIFFISIQFIFLFFTPSAIALDKDIFSKTEQPESIEELSSKIASSLPHISREYAATLAEAIYLIRELEREIFLTSQLLEIREKGKLEVEIEEIIEMPPAEEIVVTKQISEEPEESLPREDKRLIKELEKKGIVEKIRPISRRQVGIYPGRELGKDMLSAVIEREQTVLVPAVGLKRFMVTEPEVLTLAREDGKISVTGTNLGRTFLHIWDSEGRRTIKFTIRQKGYAKFIEVRKRVVEAEKMESFKTRYSFDRYRINSKSVNPDRSYHFTSWIHRLATAGETPWGKINSRVEYEGREEGAGSEDKRDLTNWDFNLQGEDLEISLGDTGAYFSDITLPGTGFQGIRFGNPAEKKINYNLVWGVRGSRMWGYKIGQWTNENYFCGVRTQIEPADFIHFNTTYMRSLEDEEELGEYLYAGGTGLNFLDDAIKIEGEAVRGKSEETDVHNHAYKIDATVDMKDFNLLLKGTYRDIHPGFLPVTGADVPLVGELGYYFDVDYNPLKYLRLSGDYKLFRSRREGAFNPDDTKAYNYDYRGTADFSIGPDTRFSYMTWRRMREGQSSPSHARGGSYSVNHTLTLPPLIRFINLHLYYTPSRLRSLGSPSSDHRSKRYGCGMRLSVLKNLYYDLGHTWYHKHMLESGEKGTVKTLSTGLSYSAQILDTPFYSSLNLDYMKEHGAMENLSLSSAENIIAGGGEIRYRPSSDFSSYLRVNYRRVRGILDHSLNRQETRIYGGGTYLFDTTLSWGVGGSVRGFVFKDLNGNGKREPDEEGIPGIIVYAGEFRSTATEADGKFEFKKLKEYEILVMCDTKMLPEGYKPTTANPQTLKLERGIVSEASFGVIAVAEISGRAFNDVNMNEIFDDGDKGVKGVLLTLDDGTLAQTTPGGYYRMEDVKPRTAILTLDAITLPFNLIPLTKAKRTLEVKKGKYYEEDFSLYALRTVVGSVFIDANGNNRFDTGEEGVADVVLRCADSTAITDSKGRFFLKKLPGRMQEVLLDVESIPAGYELSIKPSRTVELLIEGGIKEDVNFPLRKR